ncbi:hypothetical protein ACLOJK_027245 [Asimina triloba]
MELAKMSEEKFLTRHRDWRNQAQCTTYAKFDGTITLGPSSKVFPPTLQDELQAKNLYFRCGEKWTVSDHRCSKPRLNLLELEDDSTSSKDDVEDGVDSSSAEEVEPISISLQPIHGAYKRTMKLDGTIG